MLGLPAVIWTLHKIRKAISHRETLKSVVSDCDHLESSDDFALRISELLKQEEIRGLLGGRVSLVKADSLINQCASNGIRLKDVRDAMGLLEIGSNGIRGIRIGLPMMLLEATLWGVAKLMYLLVFLFLIGGIIGVYLYGYSEWKVLFGCAYGLVVGALYEYMARPIFLAKKILVQIRLGKAFSMTVFQRKGFGKPLLCFPRSSWMKRVAIGKAKAR